MKRLLILLPLAALCAGALAHQSSRGQVPLAKSGPGDLGPGEGGATLRLPGVEAPSQPAATKISPPAGGLNPWNSTSPFTPAAPTANRIAQPPSNQIAINKDLEITDKHGPWVIYAMSYSGPDAPKLAREFALEMRNNPKLKLNAFVYNSGAAEKLKEYQRVQDLRKTQTEALSKAGVKGGEVMPLRIRTLKIDEQTGVLIDGGYRTREEALAALAKLRKLPLDPKELSQRIQLDVKVAMLEEKTAKGETMVRENGVYAVFINPFTRAFPARNPTLAKEVNQTPEIDPDDVKLMRKLNESEPFSLFQVKKPLTLVIKQYNTPRVMVRNKKEAEGFFDSFKKGLFLGTGEGGVKEWTDQASINAHNLAEAFRKSGLAETYVLHAKNCSFVTVGGYDSLEDPRLVHMQNLLESRFQMDAYRPYELMARPAPLAVPR